MDKRFAGILVACVVALGIVFVVTNKKSAAPASSNGGPQLSNHIYGENKKKVTLVEYGDYQCPYCGQYYPLVKQVAEKYKTDIAFQFRNFPLKSIHQNAQAAARAAEAADKQGKFWEMHDLLYQQQSNWETTTSPLSIFETYADQLGLDKAKFRQDYQSSAVNDVINADYQDGVRLKVDATPTFFLQGKKLETPPQDVAGFSKIIDQAIKDAQK
jgi:protein-disulfide isomerase